MVIGVYSVGSPSFDFFACKHHKILMLRGKLVALTHRLCNVFLRCPAKHCFANCVSVKDKHCGKKDDDGYTRVMGPRCSGKLDPAFSATCV
jgi:hypothetical protein